MKPKLAMYAKRLDNSEKTIFNLETLRFKAYGLNPNMEGLTLYSIRLSEGNMVPYGFFINDQLVAGCYVSAEEGTLYIEQLFVHPQLQNSGLRAGRLLLNFVLLNKKELEEYFNTEFFYSALEPSDDKARAIYEKMGYEQGESLMQKALK